MNSTQLENYMGKQIEMLKKKLEQDRANMEKLRSGRPTENNKTARTIKIYQIDNIKQNIQYWESELRIYRGEETAAGR